MELQLYRHLWGVEQPLHDVLPRVRAAGYAGLELALPEDAAEDRRLAGLLAEHELRCIPLITTAGETVAEHLCSYQRALERALALGARQVTAHSGLDRWSCDEALAFYAEVAELEAEAGVPVAHETHRGRVFFNPWSTARVLERIEPLSLCCDFSHWVVVAERLLEARSERLELIADRCLHLHARVGYAEGPQVPDPRAPLHAGELAAHERWWRRVWDAQRRRGLAVSTATCEYGPPPYLQVDPSSGAALADLWDVCEWAARRLREQFEAGAWATEEAA